MPPSRYYGHYWGINEYNRLTILPFRYQDNGWDEVPLGSYYRFSDYYFYGISVLIGEYCLSGDNFLIEMDSNKFYIKGNIESSKILQVKFDASKLLNNTLKRNPGFTCVSNESETSNKFHIFINENGFVCDRISFYETSSDLCYYQTGHPRVPLYKGFEIEVLTPQIEAGIQELLITSYTFV